MHVSLPITLLLAVIVCAGARAQESGPPEPQEQRRSNPNAERMLQDLIRSLVGEAERVREARRFEHSKPDVKTRFEAERPGHTLPLEPVADAILTRQHSDPFIDAYVRWQLTSFEPDIPDLDYQPLLRVIQQAPQMVENPKARQDVLATLEHARGRRLSPDEVVRLERSLVELDDASLIAEEMNRPAMEWRHWVADRLGEKGPRPRLWMVERLRAMIAAGWPVSQVKGDLSREFSASIDDETFTIEHRHLVLNHLREMNGIERKWVKDVTVFANGGVEPTFWSSAVDSGDIDNWHKRLLGIR